MTSRGLLWYREVRAVKCGQVERFTIKYTPPKLSIDDPSINPIPPNLWLKVKNTELIALRAAYLAGPYVLYVDVTPEDFESDKQCFVTADQPVFEPQLLPGQSVYAELSCHSIKDAYTWTVDVVSQTLFNNTVDVDFEISIGTTKKILHELSFQHEGKILNGDKTGIFIEKSVLSVNNQDTLDLWNLPLPEENKPIHLVILTHGLHSNVSADMLYLKEQISKHTSSSSLPNSGETVVVKGFFGNVCKTERGIKYLGSRVAEFVVELLTKNSTFNNGKTTKISFIGHSLGGLVQTFAIAYIENNFPFIFQNIKPVNFITIASPLLGVIHENPMYVKLALLAGIVGKTGQDLGLVFLEGDQPPLLLLLPTGPTHKILKRFLRRTVYANVKNDGIVPLRTSALLYLDYKGVLNVINSNKQVSDSITNNNNNNNNSNSSNNINNNNNSNNNHTNTSMSETGTTKIPNSETLDSKTSSGILPVQAMLSFFMPQKQSGNVASHYHKFQAGSSNDEEEELIMGEGEILQPTMLESATSLILPPLPSFKYITDPSSRENIIIHDKVYYNKDLPPRKPVIEKDVEEEKEIGLLDRLKALVENTEPDVESEGSRKDDSVSTITPSLRKRLLKSLDDSEYLEEEIAREYHQDMSWRKVLVQLRPDAHNNIIVRRKYANAYGWPVISHIVLNHFGEIDCESVSVSESNSTDELDLSTIGLSKMLSRDLITKYNEEVEEESQEEIKRKQNNWINSKDDSESMFAVGPTGLLSEVSEMMGQLRDQWYKKKHQEQTSETVTETDTDRSRALDEGSEKQLGTSNTLMGEFL